MEPPDPKTNKLSNKEKRDIQAFENHLRRLDNLTDSDTRK